jgi:hypothetical protein
MSLVSIFSFLFLVSLVEGQSQESTHSGGSQRVSYACCAYVMLCLVILRLTAIGCTEGADQKFPVWDVFKEFLRSWSVLHGFG